jgi:hypothetical protein
MCYLHAVIPLDSAAKGFEYTLEFLLETNCKPFESGQDGYAALNRGYNSVIPLKNLKMNKKLKKQPTVLTNQRLLISFQPVSLVYISVS